MKSVSWISCWWKKIVRLFALIWIVSRLFIHLIEFTTQKANAEKTLKMLVLRRYYKTPPNREMKHQLFDVWFLRKKLPFNYVMFSERETFPPGCTAIKEKVEPSHESKLRSLTVFCCFRFHLRLRLHLHRNIIQ